MVRLGSSTRGSRSVPGLIKENCRCWSWNQFPLSVEKHHNFAKHLHDLSRSNGEMGVLVPSKSVL
jgi:hypothetical protein